MSTTFDAFDWKAQESTGKHTQVGFPFLADVQAPILVPPAVVAQASFSGCLNEAARHCGLADQEIADAIHVSAGYMSKFMRGVAQVWAKRLVAFMRATQCLAPLQWIADQMGCDVVQRDSRAAEVAELKARLAALERAA